MPRNLFQEIVFTLIMVVVMVYAMVCYNVALDMGGMRNEIFVIAFSELPMMGGIAFVLELFVVGPLADAWRSASSIPAATRPYS